MTVKEFLRETYVKDEFCVRPKAICVDGFRISIQASRFHYSCPRTMLEKGDYVCVELGFANKKDELIEEYKDGPVYPYVPIEVAEELVASHGGIIPYFADKKAL